MDTATLGKRDRANIYKEDADNVFVLAASTDEVDDFDGDIESTMVAAVDHLNQSGQRFAYVVIRIERG